MIEFEKYLLIAARWWWLLLLSTLLGAGAGLAVTARTPSAYRASASVLVKSGGSTGDYSAVMASEKMALTYENLITKRPVIEQAAYSLGMEPDRVADQLEVRLVSKTLVIELSVVDRDPQRAANIANAVLVAFVKTQQESGNVRSRDITVVEYASPPSKPASPNVTRNLTLASVGGLVLGAGAVLAFDLLNDRLEGVADIRNNLTIPILAVVPRQRVRRKNRSSRADMVHPLRKSGSLPATMMASPYSVSSSNGQMSAGRSMSASAGLDGDLPAPQTDPGVQSALPAGRAEQRAGQQAPDDYLEEAYRTLRTWIQFSYRDGPLPSLVITSPRSRKDVGSVVLNLGVTLARAGLRVVLVDADLREPSLYQLLVDVPSQEGAGGGLSELLSKGTSWRRYAVETDVPNLSMIPAGAPAADPLQLSNSPDMARLLRQLAKQADIVLVNAPPVLAAADALVLAAQVDGTLLVIQDRATRLKWAAQALAMLRNARADVLGAVLTGARLQPSDLPPHCDFGPPAARHMVEQRQPGIRVYAEPEPLEAVTSLTLLPQNLARQSLERQALERQNLERQNLERQNLARQNLAFEDLDPPYSLSNGLVSTGNGENEHVD